jgi:hypothetical protein
MPPSGAHDRVHSNADRRCDHRRARSVPDRTVNHGQSGALAGPGPTRRTYHLRRSEPLWRMPGPVIPKLRASKAQRVRCSRPSAVRADAEIGLNTACPKAGGRAGPTPGEPRGEPEREPPDADAPGRRRTDADAGAELAQVAEDALLSSTSPRRRGRLAQRESASLTRKRSLVQSQYRPHDHRGPEFTLRPSAVPGPVIVEPPRISTCSRPQEEKSIRPKLR